MRRLPPAVLIGCGIGLNAVLLGLHGVRFCGQCEGINAVLAFPWPVVGLAFWLGAAVLSQWKRSYAAMGFGFGLALSITGYVATGQACIVCLVHLALLGVYVLSQLANLTNRPREHPN